MVRLAGMVVATVVAVFAIGGICAYQEVMSLEVVPVTDDVSVIQGSMAGNVGVLRTERGSVVVDTMAFQMQGRRIRELAEDIGGPTQAIVNTHYHLDHTHGNPAFASGARVVATARTLGYMKLLDGDYWQGAAAGTLPNETFDGTRELRMGDKTVRLIHPGRGHTDGDLVVLFVEDRVVHTGDLFFNGRYPNIDLEAGGSVRAWSDTIDRILELEFDHVIPGHGPVTDAAGLRDFQRFIQQLADVGATAASSGTSLADTRATAALDADEGYEAMSIPLVMSLDRDFVIRRSWEEATGNFERVTLPEETE